MRKENGITLISLVITIILLLILATIGINSGVTTIKSSKLTKFTTELKIMQTEVNDLYNKWQNGNEEEKNNILQQGKATDGTSIDNVIKNGVVPDKYVENKDRYRLYDTETIKNQLQIDGVESEFFVDVQGRRVVSTEGIENEGEMCYTLEQLPDGLYNVDYEENNGTVDFDVNGQVISESRGRIKISNVRKVDGTGKIDKWQIRYRVQGEGDDSWKVTNEFTGSEYSFDVNKLEVYEVQVFHGEITGEAGKDIISDTKIVSVGKEKMPEISDTTKELVKTNGVIEVKFLSDTSYTETEKANKPILKDGMKAVYWAKDASGDIDEDNPVNNTYEITSDDSNFKEENWYNYVAQSGTNDGKTSRWANAKTSDGSYYVWIPRYAYRIVYFGSKTDENEYRGNSTITDKITGYSDARGIVDKNGEVPQNLAESGRTKTGISINDQKFRPHPAFEGNVDEGGWDTKLTGIWVMKFEASRNDATGTSEGTGIIPKSVPGVKGWRYVDANDMYKYSKNAYNKGDNLNMILNSHLMKGSEWGAIGYLSKSEYGRNGNEVTINNNSNLITGSAGGSVDAVTDVGTTTDYKSAQGVLASSTGNIYGVYDLSGGLWEFLPSYYKDGDLKFATDFATGKSDKYSTVYKGIVENNDYIPGDATYETKGWDNNYNGFVIKSQPFFYVRRKLFWKSIFWSISIYLLYRR